MSRKSEIVENTSASHTLILLCFLFKGVTVAATKAAPAAPVAAHAAPAKKAEDDMMEILGFDEE
jgi:hypothetical protein